MIAVLSLRSSRIAMLLAIGFLSLLLHTSCAQLSWPSQYYADGQIILPYGDIVEPFQAWVDMTAGKSRMDTYNGMSKVINRGDMNQMFKIVPETTQKFVNQITCFKIPGGDPPVTPQSVLPNASLYYYSGDSTFYGVNVSVYISSFVELHKENNYTLMVRKDNGFPVAVHFIGYDRLFGSHYDEYWVMYSTFTPNSVDPTVFDIEQSFDCVSFPGPGIGEPMTENIFFEFFGAEGFTASHMSAHTDQEFHSFKKQHNRAYKDETDEALRKGHFVRNFRYIRSMNRRNLSYKLAVNHLTDLSQDEMKRMRGFRYNAKTPRHNIYMPRSVDIPNEVNWWLAGAVTPVKDQGICGSCWSFGTTGTIEGSLFIKSKMTRLVSLSEQALIDCSWGYGNNGCDGGESERAYEWIIHNGCIPTEASYGQYLMEDGYCHNNQSMCGARVISYNNTKQGDVSALLAAIYTQGPISVAIDASHLSFGFYSSGVYYEPDCGNKPDDLDHQVLAVGYGSYLGNGYILVKNSWSTYWGNDGYILMSQKDNNCGIATDASFANLA